MKMPFLITSPSTHILKKDQNLNCFMIPKIFFGKITLMIGYGT